METFSMLVDFCARNSPVTGEFPAQRPMTRSFDVFFELRLNKRLCKQSWGWWFEMPLRPLWCHIMLFLAFEDGFKVLFYPCSILLYMFSLFLSVAVVESRYHVSLSRHYLCCFRCLRNLLLGVVNIMFISCSSILIAFHIHLLYATISVMLMDIVFHMTSISMPQNITLLAVLSICGVCYLTI